MKGTVEYEQVPNPLLEAEEGPEPLPGGEPVPVQDGEKLPPAGSLQAQVQAARARVQQATTKDIEIPGYDGTLWGTFRAIDDFKERARIERRWQSVRSEAQRALDVAAELLRVACLDVFVPTDAFVAGETKPGDRVSLSLTLGVELADWLGVLPENAKGLVNDHEVLFPPFIFPSTLAITVTAGQLHQFSSRVGEEADGETEGEFEASSR